MGEQIARGGSPISQSFPMQQYRQNKRPWQTRQEFLVDQALDAAISDPDTIRETRPVVPMEVFPEVRGFTKMEHGIMSVLNTSANPDTTTALDNSFDAAGSIIHPMSPTSLQVGDKVKLVAGVHTATNGV